MAVLDDGDEDLWFGDTLDFSHFLKDQYWEIEITPPSWDGNHEGDPHDLVMLATNLRKKRAEVNLKQEDQLRFAAVKEIKAWLRHKTIQRVSKGKIPDNAVMRCRWLLSWKNASGDGFKWQKGQGTSCGDWV